MDDSKNLMVFFFYKVFGHFVKKGVGMPVQIMSFYDV